MTTSSDLWAPLSSRLHFAIIAANRYNVFPQLLQFSGLTGFSLTLKDGFYAHSLHLPCRGQFDADKHHMHLLGLADSESESEPVFRRLWDMLTLRCPDLESLSIVGNSSEPSDAARLHTATWPKLRYLAFG